MIFSKNYQNGLKLILKKIDGVYSVSCGVFVHTGSSNESADNNGISHFIEHNLFKGTKKRSSLEISTLIDNIGAQINAFTSKEITCYYTKSTREHFEECIDILQDICFNSTFNDDELNKEKGVIIEEINMSEDTPEDVSYDLSAKAFYGDEGYGRTILGTVSNIKKFNKEYVADYMDSFYTADNVCIAIVGDIDVEKTERLVEKYFANNFSDKKSARKYEQKNYAYDKLFKYKNIEQTHINIVLPGFNYESFEGDALSLANVAFGGGMSSRLFQKLREELGVAYSVYSSLSAYRDNGTFEIYAGVTNDKRQQAYDAIKEEIEKIRKYGITDKEYSIGKEQIKSSLLFSQESTYNQMRLYGKYKLFLDKVFDFEDTIKQFGSISLEQVNEVCKNVFKLENYSVSGVGPFKKLFTL